MNALPDHRPDNRQSEGRSAIGSNLPYYALYTALYCSFGAASPFMPSFMASHGIAPEQIGLIFAVSTGVRLVAAPIVGRIADRSQSLRLSVAICAIAAAAVGAGYLAVSTFLGIFGIALLHAAALAPLTNLADALALLRSQTRARAQFEYGWIRGAGSAAFILGTMISGYVVATVGLSSIISTQCFLLIVVPLSLLFIPRPLAIKSVFVTASIEGISELLHMRAFRLVLLIGGLVLGSHAMHDTFAVMRWQEVGISPRSITLLWSAAVASEVIVFFLVGPWLLERLAPETALAIAALAGVLRWSVAAIAIDVAALSIIQPLHGLTFALLHLASMRLLARILPEALAATGLALYGTVGAGIGAVVTLAAGWLYARMGASGFLVMSLLCATAVPLALTFPRIQRLPLPSTP
jgi:PPP family 3-phenylpropionic acid transporter